MAYSTPSSAKSGSPKPYAGKYPQPKTPQSVGSGSTGMAPETKTALSKAAPASGYKHGTSRPKGV